MKNFSRCFLLLLALTGAVINPCAAKGRTEWFDAMKSSPYCTTTPPEGTNPEFYKWPKNNSDAYHGRPDIYYDKKMFFCHGVTSNNKNITYVWPSWPFATREDQLYPVVFVKTSAGILTQYGEETIDSTLWLNGKPFIQNLNSAKILEAYPEEDGKPRIVIVSLEDSANRFSPYRPDFAGFLSYFVIDFGVSPPFISTKSLPLAQGEDKNSDTIEIAPDITDLKIKKVDENTYEFSGDWWVPNDIKPVDHPAAKYIYDRKSGTITPRD